MSDFGVGPISKVGLVRTGNDVDLKLKLVAVDVSSFTPPTELMLDQVEPRTDGEDRAREGRQADPREQLRQLPPARQDRLPHLDPRPRRMPRRWPTGSPS